MSLLDGSADVWPPTAEGPSRGPAWPARAAPGIAGPASGGRAGPGGRPGAAVAVAGGGCVVGVVGARGGVGTSTFAAVLAARSARRTATVLVDLDAASCGVDLLLGLEDEPGVRWPDLAGARGDVPGADLLGALPRWGPCAVLAAGRGGAGVDPEVVADVLRAVASVAGAVVLDLGRGAGLAGSLPPPDAVVVVVPRDVRGVAGASAARDVWEARGCAVAFVARAPAPGGMGVAEVAHALGRRVVAAVPEVRGMAAGAERAGLVVRRPVVRAVDRVARELGAGWP